MRFKADDGDGFWKGKLYGDERFCRLLGDWIADPCTFMNRNCVVWIQLQGFNGRYRIKLQFHNILIYVFLGSAGSRLGPERSASILDVRSRLCPEPIRGGLAWHILLVSVIFLVGVFGIYAYAIDRGYSVKLTRTMAVNTLVVMEVFRLFFIRNSYGTSCTWRLAKGTKTVWTTVATIAIAQFAITYLPLLQSVFQTEPVPFLDGLIIVGIGVVLFFIIEIEKQLRLGLRNSLIPNRHP